MERIAALRARHRRLVSSIDHYELRVAEQTAQLNRMNRPRDFGAEDEEEEEYAAEEPAEEEAPAAVTMTEEDIRREEEEIRELESKKRGLEERVNSMGRDIRFFRET